MSKTFRNSYTKNLCMRKPKTLNYLLGNQQAIDELVDAGFSPRNRETAKANPQNIHNAWDDKPVSALYEIDESTLQTATETTSNWQAGEQVVLACLEGNNWNCFPVNEIKYEDND